MGKIILIKDLEKTMMRGFTKFSFIEDHFVLFQNELVGQHLI